MNTIRRFLKLPKQSFFLFGPRGTGKSTWLKEAFEDSLWIDLLDLRILRIYEAYPERLRETIQGFTSSSVIVIDEIQKVPSLLSEIHSLIEEHKGYQFVMTGSSSRKLRKKGVNLLGGRALLKHMHPFMASELGIEFALERALEIGMLPLVLSSPSPQETLQAYAGLYLKEEVQAEGLVRQIGTFAGFLEIVSFSHATLLNTANIARECAIPRKTIDNFLHILEDLLLSFTLTIFSKRAKRALIAHPKFYFFDCGVFRSLRPCGPFDRPEEIEGATLEGLVAQHLKAWIDLTPQPYELYFWRTRSGLKVDFILYGPDRVWAIEVKNSDRLSPNDFKGLQAFKADYPEAVCLLLYRGQDRYKKGEIVCTPCTQFLRDLRPEATSLLL